MIKRWFGTGMQAATTGGNFTYWFQDQSHTQPVPVSAGLPGPGDTVYFDGGAMGIDWQSGPNNPTWSGVTIAAGQTFVLGSGQGEELKLDSACTVGAGTTFSSQDWSTGFGLAANFLGDIHIVGGTNSSLQNGWKVNNGQAGGSIYLETLYGNNCYVSAPHASQIKSFKDVTISVCDGGYASLSAFTNITVTGTMNIITTRGACYVAPSGKWVTLGSASAIANGVAVSPSLVSAGGGLLVI